jgi:iron(III) transport system substrate-binding protein
MFFKSSRTIRLAPLALTAIATVTVASTAIPAQAATKTTAKATSTATKATKATKARKATKKVAKKTTANTVAPTTATTVPTTVATTAVATAVAATAPTSSPKAEPVSLKGRKLVVYSGRAERLIKPIISQFEFETGVEVSVRFADSAELAATLLEEGDRTKANIFFAQDAGALGALTKEKRFAKIPTATLNRVDVKYRADDATWVGISGRARVFVFDPRQITSPPKSIKDLIDPKYRGKVGYVPTNASFQSFVTAMRVSTGDAATKDWLTAFKNNRPVVFPSNGAVVVAANKGEIAVGLVSHYYLYERIAADGKSNVYVQNEYPEKGDLGGLVNVAGIGILKESATDPAALAFVEFMLGKEAQTYFADKTFEYPLVPSVARHPTLPPIQTVEGPAIDLSKLDSLKETLELLRSVGML